MSTITWIDVETTGLDPHENSLLEIACLVTDSELNILDEEGFQAPVYHSPRMLDMAQGECNDYVLQMHAKTGLWDRLASGTPLSQINEELAEYVSAFSAPRTSPVGGNSVRLDMNFMDRHLPLVSAHLDYHMVDVSTIATLNHLWNGGEWFEKASDHTAMTDIRECLRELRHYRKAVFK